MVSGGGGSLGELAPGSRVAGYRLEEQVGAGGMAVVFRAVDERLGRQVALKVLAPTLASDEEFRRRFIRESRAAAAVDDPHIVPVYEAGEAEGVLFIAMRYVAGGDVHALLHREGPLPPDRVAAIISPVASALDAAHAAGLVHRDVKPTNMLLDARPGRPDHVYLADFGLSRAMLSSATLTGLGMFLGTPDYVAPEQEPGGPGHPVPAGPGAGPAATRRRLVVGAALATVVVVYLAVAAEAHAFPFTQPGHPAANPTIVQSSPQITIPQISPSPLITPTPQATPTTSSQIASLAQLLPRDIPLSSCSAVNPTDYHFAVVGSTQLYDCQSGNWQVSGLLMSSFDDFAATLQNFNNWIAFDPAAAGTSCPPLGRSQTGTVPWSNRYFPPQDGQTLECWTYYSGGAPFPSYAWAFPTENAFLWATGNAGTSWSELNTWWQDNETQAAAPSPSP